MTRPDTLRKIRKLTSFKSDLEFANLGHGEAIDLIEYVNKLATQALQKRKKKK
jgi:hypothetical protein